MVWVAGVDGCGFGWVMAESFWLKGEVKRWSIRLAKDLDALFAGPKLPAQIALDMPVGLLDKPLPGGRDCDRQARRLLGFPRSSSVFSPPSREVLNAQRYDEVRHKGVTLQAFHLMPKIRMVDAWLTPKRQERVFESHPEVAFFCLAGHGMRFPKRKRAGFAERIANLTTIYPNLGERFDLVRPANKHAAKDDLLDALVLSWVAYRKLMGIAICLPEQPPRDTRGLEMAIWC